MADDVNLQAQVPAKLGERFDAQADKFGMTKREFFIRLMEEALPHWENAPAPAPLRKIKN